jgi:hypothetical protein
LAKRQPNNEKSSIARVVDEACRNPDNVLAKALQDKSMDGNLVINRITAESQSSDGLSASTSRDQENSMDLLMDFNFGDIILSDFLDDSEMFNMNITVREGDALAPPLASYTQLSPEEMLQTWSPSDCILASVDSDFRSLASFLE